jgi:23S rRNA (adenine2503-C2)-methyltransferase
MTSIPARLIGILDDVYSIRKIDTMKKYSSADADTTKYLFKTENSNIIESVLMKHRFGNSVCISSQAGCRMGCVFCASTLNGLERGLSPGEMLGQIYRVSRDSGERVANIVVMGCGEPLDNYDALIAFLRIINDKNGLNIGQRHITVSTCGLLEKIEELMSLRLQITLAVSLHAPNDEIRRRLMPIARAYPVDALLGLCARYAETTGRRVTYEYALIAGVNDSAGCAAELAGRLKGTLSHVNLIPVNEVKELGFKRSGNRTVPKFFEIREEKGIDVTVRREMGGDINAACGQLRNNARNH